MLIQIKNCLQRTVIISFIVFTSMSFQLINTERKNNLLHPTELRLGGGQLFSFGLIPSKISSWSCGLILKSRWYNKPHINSERNRTDADSLYKPIKKDILLFYIQLSENKNIIVYDMNYNADKTINEKNPVHTYWIRYSESGQIQELTYFQKHFVYGLEAKLIDSTKKNYTMKFASYKKRNLYLIKKEKTDKYYPYMSIHGKLSLLNKIFIQVESKKFGLPKVKYVELHGKEISNDNPVVERIIP